MNQVYTQAQQALQDEFDTRRLADRLSDTIFTRSLNAQQTRFIESRDMLFLATVDSLGFPSCSYKGGMPGFVRVINPETLMFPSYDGNGMFMSMGNIEECARVGLLFIDFERPERLRVRGSARLLREGPLLASYPGADLVVELTLDAAWQNCPRYVHTMTRTRSAPHVPDASGASSLALWKRIDALQDVLSERDRTEAQALGVITGAEYQALLEAQQGALDSD